PRLGGGLGQGVPEVSRDFNPSPHPSPSRSRIYPTSASLTRRSRVNPRSLVALALRCARDTKAGLRATKCLTRVTRIFQKRAFTKAAHDAREEDRCGLFCLRQPQWFFVFHCYFLPVFVRDGRVDCAPARPQVAGARLKGCGH